MSDHTAKLTEQDLKAHADWIEGLARALARDEHNAQDLIQETWVAALEHPPLSGTPLRPWFARVLRNAFLSRQRSERNRKQRESVAAQPLTQDGSSDVLARLESERLLFEALEALDVKANIERLPIHPGDLTLTHADVSKAQRLLQYAPTTTIESGIQKFVAWFQTTL